ncbi:signal peptidase II [Ilumatobacter fluminis]|uniref:Lipoprotein signal peptidase n=1 Tax=Ilumatobacter fluminis TaxID=467091 RepID=A0A4R7HYD0_9ACTN|nr:signal peptidase II [Ilumatobacter fluminis]TDT16227.1 signal peptidase II [Ilumatobacter fluminis]
MSLLPSSARRWAPIALAVVVLDQLTKWWALNTLDDRDIDLFWTLRFNLSFNNGMAFSQGEGLGPVIGVLALVVIVALVLSVRREDNALADVAVGLIVGGAIGNVIDRLFRDPAWMRGAVVDFIDFQWFPIFNVADMGITIGGILLIAVSWWSARQAEQAEQAEQADGVAGDGAGETNDSPESKDA